VSAPITPVKLAKIKKEPESENRAPVKIAITDPDEYLKSEYEKHKKVLAEKTKAERYAESALAEKMQEVRNTSKALKERTDNEHNAGKAVKEVFGGPVKGADKGKEYFLEFHIKQLEEKLDQARLREAENNVEIRNLKAQVGMLIEKSEKHTLSEATPSVFTDFTSRADEDLRQRCLQLEGEIAQNVLGSQQDQGQVNGQQNQAGKQQVNQEDQQDQSVQPTIDASQVNNKQRQVTPELGDSKEKVAHIAAITFTAPIVTLVTKLKSAIAPSELEEWFDKQITYTFKCAGEGNFEKMVNGYRDFVDYIGDETRGTEKESDEKFKEVLRECEELVCVVFEVDEMLE
jgi:hypothetical protein